MKKKRILYSELADTAKLARRSGPMRLVEDEAKPDIAPKPQRVSTPVDLARALAAARAAEEAERVAQSPVPVPAPALKPDIDKPFRELARQRAGQADLLAFHVGRERFAVELLAVDEVIDLPTLHHVPEMPAAMLGVVNVRGSLTPVYTPEHVLGAPLASRDALLIFRRGAARIGILIDDVDDALGVDLSELREAPGDRDGESAVLGVIQRGASLIGIVDADTLIAACQSSAALLEIA